MMTRRRGLMLFKMVEALTERVAMVMVRMTKMVVGTKGEMAVMAENQPSIFCTIGCRYGIKTSSKSWRMR